MANNENLKPFKKGDPRINKNGRPRKLPGLTDVLTKILGEDDQGKSLAIEILEKWGEMAKKGNLKAGEMLLDRAYVRVKQSIDKNLIQIDNE